MDRKWWKEAVVYEIYPRSFMDSNGDGIGDLKGVTSRLDYIKDLGADCIWLCPVYSSPNVDNGYDIADYRQIMADFGTMADFDELIGQAHARGIRIVMDLVVNHSSDQHVWFQESRKGRDNPYSDYYIWRDPVDGHEPTNWMCCFGGPAWTWDAQRGQYYFHEFAAAQPDLNWENPKVREEVYDMMNWWCSEKGVDGFRMDVITLISKPETFEDGPVSAEGLRPDAGQYTCNGPKIHDYLREMHREVLSRYDLLTVGEASGSGVEDALLYTGFDRGELGMCFTFEHMDCDADEHGKWTMKPLYLPNLKRVMSRWETGLEGRGWNSLYWDNHDQPRIVSRWGNTAPQWWALSAKMLATCLHMMQGTPYIYQGEEIGMVSFNWQSLQEMNDVEEHAAWETYVDQAHIYTEEEMLAIISRKGRDNARTPMQWDTSPQAGFTTGTPWLPVNPSYKTINAAAQIHDPDSIYSYYKQLIALRKAHEIIIYGDYRLLEPEDEDLFIYTRRYEGQQLLVICNFSDRTRTLPDSVRALGPAPEQILISNYREAAEEIRPYEAVVYKQAAPADGR